MKKILIIIACMMAFARAYAVPACPTPQAVSQPDGSTVTLVLHGDEFYHYSTTVDGYTVVKDANGFYNYARVDDNGELAATGVVAHDEAKRGADEIALLARTEKNLIAQPSTDGRKKAKARRDARNKLKTGQFDYSNFKGLVVLINFSDTKFRRSDVSAFYNRMINEHNYTGYTNENGTRNAYGSFTGSVRDYFYDNSLGKFDPQFTVVGPVDVDYTADQCGSGYTAIFKAALRKAYDDGLVNYADYDTDHDGVVDMVYFIVAGGGANFQGNSSDWLWPHMSSFWNTSVGGTSFGLYACSVEMYGPPSYNIIDGIGTMCHEFGHVLGLPDLYDTDYESNGQSNHPGEWDIMAGGSYNNYSRTPVGYSLYDRVSVGFSEPTVIKAAGDYSLESLGATGKGYKLLSPTDNEFFYIENRQVSKWDAMIPGHGMIVARVDSTNTRVWEYNTVNANSSRNYYQLLRAGNSTSGATGSDPFPGTKKVSMLTNVSKPSLRTFRNQPNDYIFSSITERNGVISFTVAEDGSLQSLIEDFETMPIGETNKEIDVEGTFYRWDFTAAQVVKPEASGVCNGEQAVAMVSPSMISASSDLYLFGMYLVTCNVNNPTGSAAKLKLSMSLDNGNTWTTVKASDGSDNVSIAANSQATPSWTVDVSQPVRFRINQTSGNKRNYIYLDDITLYYQSFPDDEIVVNDLTLDREKAATTVGGTIQLLATATPENATNTSLTWKTSDSSVASVDKNGLVTGKAIGEAIIRVMSNDGSNLVRECVVTIVDGILGDVNDDGAVDISDVVAIANAVMGDVPPGFRADRADVNGVDGMDITDVVYLANKVMGI
ncbi:MAG: M6 family metalloprotease domain-containing protein [Muribaculaceae bacterium]|nr:M6 family metalloprotease domain-containing protein [Muribaculaceae bacterium]